MFSVSRKQRARRWSTLVVAALASVCLPTISAANPCKGQPTEDYHYRERQEPDRCEGILEVLETNRGSGFQLIGLQLAFTAAPSSDEPEKLSVALTTMAIPDESLKITVRDLTQNYQMLARSTSEDEIFDFSWDLPKVVRDRVEIRAAQLRALVTDRIEQRAYVSAIQGVDPTSRPPVEFIFLQPQKMSAEFRVLNEAEEVQARTTVSYPLTAEQQPSEADVENGTLGWAPAEDGSLVLVWERTEDQPAGTYSLAIKGSITVDRSIQNLERTLHFVTGPFDG